MLAGALMLASFGYEMAEAGPASPKVTELLHIHLVGSEGKDAHVITVELARSQISGRHYHPGPELIYILEGRGAFR
jgi:quercetin dioxygenase-like cupin family protein